LVIRFPKDFAFTERPVAVDFTRNPGLPIYGEFVHRHASPIPDEPSTHDEKAASAGLLITPVVDRAITAITATRASHRLRGLGRV
jgi:hypothetical protein